MHNYKRPKMYSNEALTLDLIEFRALGPRYVCESELLSSLGEIAETGHTIHSRGRGCRRPARSDVVSSNIIASSVTL